MSINCEFALCQTQDEGVVFVLQALIVSATAARLGNQQHQYHLEVEMQNLHTDSKSALYKIHVHIKISGGLVVLQTFTRHRQTYV